MTRERLEALCRLLTTTGHLTPYAERMLLTADTQDRNQENPT